MRRVIRATVALLAVVATLGGATALTAQPKPKFFADDPVWREVDTQDAWQVATLGIVCVSDDRRHTNEVLSKVIEYIESERLDADIGDVEMELIAV